MGRYEVVVNLKCKSVVEAESEEEAVKNAIKVRTERVIISGTKESVLEVPVSTTSVIIDNISKAFGLAHNGKKYCSSCEKFKDAKGFKKDRWNNMT